jgi:hypothetical protein
LPSLRDYAKERIKTATKKRLLERGASMAGKGAKGVAKALKWSVTREGKLAPGKAIMIYAPMIGAYLGMKKGQGKFKPYRYHGPHKPEVVYQDPRRRLR